MRNVSLNTKYDADFFSSPTDVGVAFVDLERNAMIFLSRDEDTGALAVYDYIDGNLYDLSIADYASFYVVNLLRDKWNPEKVVA
jgi:hypothetical protein